MEAPPHQVDVDGGTDLTAEKPPASSQPWCPRRSSSTPSWNGSCRSCEGMKRPAFPKSESVGPGARRQSSVPSPPPAASSRAVALRYASRPSSRDQYASKAGRFSIRS